MIKTNKTKIEWTDRVWNPVTGCLHNCWYCYAKRMFNRFHRSFEPTFYPERFCGGSKLKEGTKIFVCSVADLFAEWTNPVWRYAVLNEISKSEYNHLTFQLLTKCPIGIPKKYEFPPNVWVGITATNQKEVDVAFEYMRYVKAKIKFLSLEPLLKSIYIPLNGVIDWLIIGKLTGSRKVRLNPNWVDSLILQARYRQISIFIKDNIKWHEKIQEFPE